LKLASAFQEQQQHNNSKQLATCIVLVTFKRTTVPVYFNSTLFPIPTALLIQKMALKVANTVVALVYVIPLCGFLTTFSLFYAGVNNNTMNQQMNLSHQAIGAGLVPEYAISFLSDTINFYPTSNIGAMFISIAAFFFLLTFFIRHIEVNKKAAERLRGPLAGKRANVRRIQIAAAVLGACSGFGAVGVAAFQEHINIVVHLAMAGLFFLLGTLYCCLQTAIDLIMKLESKRVRLTRLLVCSFMIISTIVCK